MPPPPNSVNGGQIDNRGMGTTVNSTGVNPFEQDVDAEKFQTKKKDGGYGFNDKNGLKAKQYTQEAYNILAERFNQIEAKMNEIIRKHPNTPAANYAKNVLGELYSIDLGKFPKPETEGKQEARLEAYKQDLFGRTDEVTGKEVSPDYVDRMLAELDALDNDSELNMLLSQMNANTGAIIMNDNRNAAQIMAVGQANLAATMNVHQTLVEGLKEVSEQINTATHTVIKAVNAQGQRVIRAIDKATGEIITVVKQEGEATRSIVIQEGNETRATVIDDGNLTRWQDFHNTLGLHDNIDYTRDRLGYKIEDQGRLTRNHVTNEHDQTRQHVTDQVEEHTTSWHGLPDPFGLGDWLFD